ncbi:MAG: hypothetical protein H6702_10815 [Myxococcales bacterium]|nr:hypothetical protein [Myxococcales bacterium]
MKRLLPHLLTPFIAFGCSPDDAEPTPSGAAEVRLSNLTLGHDPGRPVYLNHRIPVSFDLAATAATDGEPEPVAVTFSFTEPGGDPEADVGCSSSAIVVTPPADGSAQTVRAFIWPTTDCAALVGEGRELALAVDFFREAPIAGEVAGALPTLDLAPGEIDLAYGLSATSSVALLPFVAEGESPTPALVVQSSLVYNGRDPYVARVTAGEIPEALRALVPSIGDDLNFGLDAAGLDAVDALPAPATLRYSLSPEGAPDRELPLTVGRPDGSRAASVTIERVDPGIAMGLAHDLYIEGETLAALSAGGDLADETAFVVRGCLQAPFAQALGDDEDCQTVAVELAREAGEASGATELSFDRRLERSLGNDRINVAAVMETTNRLSREGAFTRTEGRVELNGRLGRSFSVTMVGAHAEAELSAERAAYDAAVVAFDDTLFSVSDAAETTLTNEQEFSADKSFRIGSLGFGFGPARIGFTIDVGGRVGLIIEDELAMVADGDECQTLLATDEALPACGRVARTVTPEFSLTARIFGGLNLRVVRAGVEANLRLIETRFPLVAELAFGLSEAARFLVRGGVDWDMTLQLINGNVQIVGSVGIRRFRRTLRVNLFSFASAVSTFDLLDRSMDAPEELL